jgi:predicted DNA-binding transcriptional regulator YafY
MSISSDHWEVFRRALLQVALLLQGDLSSEELLLKLRNHLPEDALGQDAMQALKKDRKHLADTFDVVIRYSRKTHTFHLVDLGKLRMLYHMPPAALIGLIQLQSIQSAEVLRLDALQQALIARLPPETLKTLSRQKAIIKEFGKFIDSAESVFTPLTVIEQALTTKRILQFDYLASTADAEQPRLHRVVPHQVILRDEHLYLVCYGLYNRQGEQEFWNVGEMRLRITAILTNENLRVLPDQAPPVNRPRPNYPLHYILSGPLAKRTPSPRFEQMAFHRLANGDLEVTAMADSYWEAARILVGYGGFCKVLGGEQVLQEVKKRVDALYGVYFKG